MDLHPAWDIYQEHFLTTVLEHILKKPWFFASWGAFLRTVMKRWARAAAATPPPLTKRDFHSETIWETSESSESSESDDDWGQVGSALRRLDRRDRENHSYNAMGTWIHWYLR